MDARYLLFLRDGLTFAVLLCLFGRSTAGADTPAHATTQSAPNIVLFIADDMGWNDCGAYGHPHIRTPHIDRLAREGMRFEHAYLTISSCSPSRASIITGRYPHNTDAEELHWPVPEEQVTFVEKLREAGYYTAAAGKWHLGQALRGRFRLVREADVSGFQLPSGSDRTGEFLERALGAAKSGCDQWLTVLRQRPPDRPFFLWLAAIDPHRPYERGILAQPHQPQQVRVPPFHPDTPSVREDYARYYDEITRFDSFVGQVLAELDRQNLSRNTVVLLISDNGRPFPRCKTTLYDSGIRTPLIVRWPAQIRADSHCRSLVSSLDLASTILDLAGLQAGETFMGRSFRKLFREPNQAFRAFVVAEKNWHDFEDHARAVRTPKYKYIRNGYPDLPNTPPADAVRSPTYLEMLRLRDLGQLGPDQQQCFQQPRPPEELYDLQSDPHELHNLVSRSEYAPVVSRLRKVLDRWEQETGDYVPQRRTPDEFDRMTGRPLPNRQRPRASKQQMVEAGLVAP